MWSANSRDGLNIIFCVTRKGPLNRLYVAYQAHDSEIYRNQCSRILSDPLENDHDPFDDDFDHDNIGDELADDEIEGSAKDDQQSAISSYSIEQPRLRVSSENPYKSQQP